MAQAEAAFGTVLRMSDMGDPEAYTEIGGVRDISGPEIDVDEEDVTAHDSEDGWEQLIFAVKRSGEVTFEINLDFGDSTHDEEDGLLSNIGEIVDFQLELSNSNKQIDFSAAVTGVDFDNPVEGARTAEITLKPTGQVTFDDVA